MRAKPKFYVQRDGKVWEFARPEFLAFLNLGATNKPLNFNLGFAVDTIDISKWTKEDFEQALREQRGCPED